MYAHGIRDLNFEPITHSINDKSIIKPRSLKFEKNISYMHYYNFQFELEKKGILTKSLILN